MINAILVLKIKKPDLQVFNSFKNEKKNYKSDFYLNKVFSYFIKFIIFIKTNINVIIIILYSLLNSYFLKFLAKKV